MLLSIHPVLLDAIFRFTNVLLWDTLSVRKSYTSKKNYAVKKVFPTGLWEWSYPYIDKVSANWVKLKRQFLGNLVFTEICLYSVNITETENIHMKSETKTVINNKKQKTNINTVNKT